MVPIPHSSGDGGDSSSGGGSRGKPPNQVSLTNPQATWVARPGVDPFFTYDANYLIDNKAGIIVDAEDIPLVRSASIVRGLFMIGATVLAASVACRATLRLERLRQCCNFKFTINHPQVWRPQLFSPQ